MKLEINVPHTLMAEVTVIARQDKVRIEEGFFVRSPLVRCHYANGVVTVTGNESRVFASYARKVIRLIKAGLGHDVPHMLTIDDDDNWAPGRYWWETAEEAAARFAKRALRRTITK